MRKKEILMPFDLDKAKAGAKVKTANGNDVRILCYDARGNDFPIVALINDKEFNQGKMARFKETGQWLEAGFTSSNDLRIVEERDERWLDRMDGKVNGWCVTYKGDAVKAFSKGKEKDGWKSIAIAAVAAAQISQIMENDERFGGVITDEEWNNEEIDKFFLHRTHDEITLSTTVGIYNFIAFHTKEQAALFLEENRDLVEQFYML